MTPRLGLCTLILVIVVSMINLNSNVSAGEEKETKGGEGEYYRNRISLGIGNTHEHGENGLTGLLIYTRVVHRLIGIGALVEYAGGDFDRRIAAFRLSLRPYKGIRLIVAPGLEREEGENSFWLRLGVGYEFEFGRWSIAPEFSADLVEGEYTYVYGLVFGWGW